MRRRQCGGAQGQQELQQLQMRSSMSEALPQLTPPRRSRDRSGTGSFGGGSTRQTHGGGSRGYTPGVGAASVAGPGARTAPAC